MDWATVSAAMYTEEAKRAASGLRNMVIEQHKQIEDFNKKTAEIDWEHWTKELNPTVVSKYQAALKEITSDQTLKPTFDIDLQAFETDFKSIVAEAKKMEEEALARVKVLEEEYKLMTAEKERIATVSVDEELAANPKLAKEIDDEIAAGNLY